MYTKLAIFFMCFFVVQRTQCQLFEGDNCTWKGSAGTCKKLKDCPSAIAGIRKGIQPYRCSFKDFTAIVCCTDSSTAPPPGPACPPMPAEYTKKPKTGQKAWDKCYDYLEYIFPCKTIEAVLGVKSIVRENLCSHSATELILGGVPGKPNEFPHMALLGFDDTARNIIHWDCGGTLISDEWVMTAGHCMYNREYDSDVKHVRLGGGDADTPAEPEFVYTVTKIEKHPDYVGNRVYNDLALLKLDRKVKFSISVIPACLHVGNQINDNKFLATGWGVTKSKGDRSNKLLKVTLEKFAYDECTTKHPRDRKSPQGLLNDTQLCAGSHTEVKDTCQGDSGGPLQIYNTNVECTYTVVGVTSIGKACGVIGLPGIYTRVSAFIPWIESIVWP